MIEYIAVNISCLPEKVDILLKEITGLSSLIDYSYLFYPKNRIKLFLIGITKDEVKKIIKNWCAQEIILGHNFIEDKSDLYVDMIIACATRKIVEYIKERTNTSDVEKLVTELVSQPHINALAYAPLHFICNQLKINYDEEKKLRIKLILDPRYNAGYKQLGTLMLR